MNILQQLAQSTKNRYKGKEVNRPLALLKEQAELCTPLSPAFPFARALRKEGLSVICEIKKASPSKGIISSDFPYLEIAKEYAIGGGDAISVLTEPSLFLGKDRYLSEIAPLVSLPLLRKDFTVCPYQIYEAKLLGASSVLLICALLSDADIESYLQLCEDLGLDALVEAHDKQETERAIALGAKIIGVNNRDLKTFKVDLETSIRLRNLVPPSIIFVSESGIETKQDTRILRSHGIDAVLVGECLMRSFDKAGMIKGFKG
ncbi:Indole-3-glycerol phosphate synthase [Sphaerochaeta pleomorpha str. Grapes]|uniref:Indole-3-glycerol phosphate synthase n=1 Tax=Sphaerochaeta pleomorpha (strain ATCC BAA-1885 / DSM 22778 / Grapes) TaxID=158190 RepID=G8QQT3_SPHPG|nr:indole-3-glycerol phosphate synthase TrpC [Sphaerochaeta pleomorpha]AEV28714.1 Indole-3-glycerol phosphate synthase [Sphaerochaeta pleomorpha str. Grapes]